MEESMNIVETNNITIYKHKSTSNKSFLEMSDYLKSIGIKNHDFMLALLDPDLAYVDPHDPNLSYQLKIKILMEVRNNFWYYLREVVRIPNAGEPSKFILNRGNMAFLFLATMNINTILLMPRQTGKTIAAVVFYVYVYNFRAQNTQISLLNKEARDSKENLSRIRAVRDLLPTYLRFDAVFSEINGKKTKVPNTISYMENAFNHNKLKTYGKAMNELQAANMLRGQTFPLLWADEFAFINFIKVIYSNMIPAMSKASEIARRNNVPYGILYTTTPGFLTSESGKYAYNIINNSSVWNEHWYDLSYYQIMGIIESNRLSRFVYIEYQYYQLGLSEKWLEERFIEENSDWLTVRREYLLEWSDESEDNPFTKEELDTIAKYCKNPIKTEMIFGKYELKIFEMIPLKTNLVPLFPPIIGVDPSGGISRDFSCLTFIDSRTTRVFAELRCNTISLIDLARVIEYIVLRMMPNAVINIERNGGYGLSVISKLKETKVKKNLYYEMKEKVIEEEIINGQLVRRKKMVKVYGLDSGKRVRNEVLIEILKERVALHKDKFISPTIHKEMTGLIVKKNGNMDHSELTHDDQIFSYLLALYVWYEGKHLRDYWGIEKGSIKTDEDIDDVVDLETSDKNVKTDISKAMRNINVNTDNKEIMKMEYDLSQLNKAKGMMFNEFAAFVKKRENEHLREMLTNKVYKEASARNYGVHPDTVDINVGLEEETVNDTLVKIPDSVFLDFDKEEKDRDPLKSVYDNNGNMFY